MFFLFLFKRGHHQMTTAIGKIANTLFSTGPDDALAATDVYSPTPSARARTSIPGIAGNLFKEVSRAGLWLGSSDGFNSVISSIGRDAKGRISLDPNVLKDRLIQASGGIASPFNDLVGKTQQAILGNLSETAGNLLANAKASFPQAFVLFDNVKTLVGESKCSNEAQDTVRIANAAIPNFGQFIDAPAQFSVFKRALDEASCLNLFNLAEGILNKFPGTEGIKLALSSARSVLDNGNVNLLNLFADITGVDALRSRYPNLINDFLENFNLFGDLSPIELGNQRNNLYDTLNRFDESWGTTTRNGTTVSDLGTYNKISEDARRIMSLNPEDAALAQIAGSYVPQNVDGMLSFQYPLVPVR